MVNFVALWTVALPLLAVPRGAYGGSVAVSAEVDINLNLNLAGTGKIAAAWWASWHPDLLPLDKVSWKKYTHMTYAFA